MGEKLLVVSEEHIERYVAAVSKIGNLTDDPVDGFTRRAWSDEESAAVEYVKDEAETAGLVTEYDAVGNLLVTLRPTSEDEELVLTGSHVDSVPEGGTFDGAAGVLTGLAGLKKIHETGQQTKRNIGLVVLRCEESAAFGTVYAGTKAIMGISNPETLSHLARDGSGVTLEEAIESQGFDPSRIRNQIPTWSQERLDHIHAFVELHIEQGPTLDNEGLDIGVVTGIRGPTRYEFKLFGEWNHSGTTPMELRRDVHRSMCEMGVNFYQLGDLFARQGNDIVYNMGEINGRTDEHPLVDRNAMTKVPGYCWFNFDVRSLDDQVRVGFVSEVLDAFEKIADKGKIRLEIKNLADSRAVLALDEGIMELSETYATNLGYSHIRLPSGAGHDTALFSHYVNSNGGSPRTGMIFVPCKGGISHAKEEYTSVNAITRGANVLANTLYNLAR